MQASLFGNDTPQPATDPAARTTATPINDLDLIGSVVRTATETGYVLIGQGTTARVLLRDAGRKGWAVTVPVYEAAAVLQLLDAGHLRRGGAHHIHHGDHQGPAAAVLVPDATRAMARRWAARYPLPRQRR